MNNNSNNNRPKSPLEIFRELSADVSSAPRAVSNQIFGEPRGEIAQGREIVFNDELQRAKEENKRLKQQLANEHSLRKEQEVIVETRKSELKLEVHALIQEMQKMAKPVSRLDEEIKVTLTQVSTYNVDTYTLNYVQKLRIRIIDFIEGVEKSAKWLRVFNRRHGRRRGMQGRLQDGSFLSTEDYVARSTG